MVTRIRYVSTPTGQVTKNAVSYNNSSYTVTIDNEFNWTILENLNAVSSGSAKTNLAAKTAVRKAFLTLGVFLGSETRTTKRQKDLAAKVI